MLTPQAESVDSTPPENSDGSSPDEKGEKQTEDQPEGKSEVETSPTGGEGEQTKDYWDQYPDEEARRKALNETKRYAAETARKAKELEAKLAEVEKSKTKETPAESVKEEEVESETPVDDWINKALNLKEGHTEDQLRIAQINYEVARFQKEVVVPAGEALKAAEAAFEKISNDVRDQRAHVTKLKAKAENNSLYADDLKEAVNELRDLEKAQTDARLDRSEAREKFSLVQKEERDKKVAGLQFAKEAVEKLSKQSREAKAQKEREAQEAKAREESNKAWQSEFEKALKASGLDGTTDKAKKMLHAAAYAHIYDLNKAGQITDETDLQPLLKEAFSPYLELKSSAPAMESAVERKKAVTDEPGPENRRATKAGEEQPKTLDEWRAAAKRGMKNA